jgi:DNA-3-methyladenine glycosylase II
MGIMANGRGSARAAAGRTPRRKISAKKGSCALLAKTRMRASAKLGRRSVVAANGTAPLVILDSEAALVQGFAALAALDPVMAALMEKGARPMLRKRPAGFHGLAGIIMAQQLSVASAAAIWGRLTAAIEPFEPAGVLAASDATLRTAGLSAAKIRTLRAIAEAISAGTLPLEAFEVASPEAAHGALTAVKGIGPWTADVYLLFCLGHPDVFPAGDLALQEAARVALRMRRRPDETKLRTIAARWHPWRGVAALALWSYYRLLRQREGMLAPGSRG